MNSVSVRNECTRRPKHVCSMCETRSCTLRLTGIVCMGVCGKGTLPLSIEHPHNTPKAMGIYLLHFQSCLSEQKLPHQIESCSTQDVTNNSTAYSTYHSKCKRVHTPKTKPKTHINTWQQTVFTCKFFYVIQWTIKRASSYIGVYVHVHVYLYHENLTNQSYRT